MPRYRLIVAYDGTDFHGWQKQNPPDRTPLRTAQGVLETVLKKVLKEPIRVSGSSRTDTGVHSRGQVAVFTTSRVIKPEGVLRALNSRLPSDLQIRAVDIVHDKFDPITHCTSKGYRYMFAHGCSNPRRKPLFDRHFITHTPHILVLEKMQEAAVHLIGEHDFAAFTRVNHRRATTIRRIDSCTVSAPREWRIAIDVSGSGFLWNMVRIIAGTLHEVGRGKFHPDEIPKIILSCDRKRTGKTMPPQGLCLEWVKCIDQ